MDVKKRFIFPALVCIVVIAALYYATYPAINIKNVQFWWFIIWCLIIIGVCFWIPRAHDAGTSFIDDIQREGLGALLNFKNKRKEKKEEEKASGSKKKHGFFFWLVAVILVLIIGMFVGITTVSSP